MNKWTGKKIVGLWPDDGQWIISADVVDQSGAALSTDTLDVLSDYTEARHAALVAASERGVPAYEDTGIYGFSRPLTEAREDAPTCATCGDSSAWGTHSSCERDEGLLLVLTSEEDI